MIAHQEEKKRLLNHIDKLKRDMTRIVESRQSHNKVLSIIENNSSFRLTLGSQTQHDMILESYLKQGVYRTLSKSPLKKTKGPDEFHFLPQTRTTVNRNQSLSTIVTCAFIDRREPTFFERKGNSAIKMGSYSKYTVYEKSAITGEALLESKGVFNEVFSGDNPDKLLSGLTRMTTSSSDKSFSFVVIGLKEKIYISQVLLRLFLDQIASRKLSEFSITGSDTFIKVLLSILGDSITPQGTSFRIDSESFVSFAQAIELLSTRILGEEFYFSIEFNRRNLGEPQYFNFAGVKCYEELRKFTPIKKTESDKSFFIRKMIQLNFRQEESSPQTDLFIDRFLSYPLKIMFSYSHLVRDYLNDHFLTELSQLYYEERQALHNPLSPIKLSENMPVSPSNSFLSHKKRGEKERNVDDKVREAASHVKNIFKYMN